MTMYQTVTLSLVVVTLFYYGWCGIRLSKKISRASDYLLIARHLSRADYTQTFVATSTSLATALSFFIMFGAKFGLALIISPIMFSLGVVVFKMVTPFMQADGFFENGTTLHQYLKFKFQDETVKNLATIVSVLGYLGIFIIELYVGVKIFTIFNQQIGWQVMIASFLLILIFTYIYLGGYPAVIKTDNFQLKLIVSSIFLLLIVLLYAINHDELWDKVLTKQYLNPLPLSLPWYFVVVMIVGNVPFQLLKMSNWHRAAAAGKLKKTQEALTRGWQFTFIIWLVATLCGIFGGVLADKYGIKEFNLNALFLMLSSYLHSGLFSKFFVQYIVYPLLFAGCVAALISTADSVFIPLLATYVFDLKYQNINIEETQEISSQVLKSTRKVISIFMLIGVIIYVILTYFLKFDFVDLLFIFFNQQLVLFPVVWFALMNKPKSCAKFKKAAIFSIIVSSILTWAIALYGGFYNKPHFVMLSSAVGFLGSIIFFYLRQPKALVELKIWRDFQ